MPLPIHPISAGENNSGIDYSFLNSLAPQSNVRVAFNAVSNKDAECLMKIWLSANKKGNYEFELGSNIVTSSELMRLKTNGLVEGDGDGCKITSKGKNVITTMTLSESNRFLRTKKNKTYNEILASISKKGKKGYRIAFSNGTIDISDKK